MASERRPRSPGLVHKHVKKKTTWQVPDNEELQDKEQNRGSWSTFLFFFGGALQYFKDGGYQEHIPQRPVLLVFSPMVSKDKHAGAWQTTQNAPRQESSASYLFALSFSSSSIRFSMQFFLKKRTDDYSSASRPFLQFCLAVIILFLSNPQPKSRGSQAFSFQQNPFTFSTITEDTAELLCTWVQTEKS